MVPQIRIPVRIFLSGFALFVSLSGLSAWARAAGEPPAAHLSIRQEVEHKSLEDAMLAFESGDYMRAATAFDILSDGAQTPEVGRQALFGLAAVKLILALTVEEYEDALSAWERWSDRFGPRMEAEDPRMITPFLRRLHPAFEAAGMGGLEMRDRKAPRAIDFKAMLQTKEKEVETLRSRLDQREREIKRLRHQLESLEEIHRKYQEKKQEATP